MHFLILQDYLRCGGTEQQTLFLAAAWTRLGHPVTVLTFRPGGPLLKGRELPPGMSVKALQSRDTGWNWFAPGLVRAVRQHRPGIILCMGKLANCYAAYLRFRLPAIPVVSSVRTGKPLPWLYRRGLRSAPLVIANSEAAARLLRERGWVRETSLEVIKNALVRPPVTPADHAASRHLRPPSGSGPEPVIFAMLAMFRPEKNQRALLDHFAQLALSPPPLLWLLGDGETRPACEAYARELGLSDRVHFWGAIDHPLPHLLATDVVVHTSLKESLPNALVEAQSLGKPVVAYDTGGVRECFREGLSGTLVPVGEGPAFVQAMSAWASQPDRRQSAQKAAQAHFQANFEPTRQAERFVQVFQPLLHQKTPD